MSSIEMSRTDLLAVERTKLANERTFLAYFRTFAVLLGSGLAVLKIEMFNQLSMLGYFFIALSLVIFIIGIARFFYTKRTINRIAG